VKECQPPSPGFLVYAENDAQIFSQMRKGVDLNRNYDWFFGEGLNFFD